MRKAERNTSCQNVFAIAEEQKAKVDPMYHDKIDSLVESYCRKLAANTNKGFEIDSRYPSVMISGAGNFNTRKKEKQNAARQKNWEERKKIEAIIDKIKGVGTAGISSDDPNAIAKLQKKLEGLQELQETMKSVNAYYRKHGNFDGCPVSDKIKKVAVSNLKYGHALGYSLMIYQQPKQDSNLKVAPLNGRQKPERGKGSLPITLYIPLKTLSRQ